MEGKGKGGERRGGERGGNVEGPGKWSAPGPALALGGPDCHHHSRHPALLHSFTPGSKPTFLTNPSHLRLLLPTELFMTTGLERTYHSHRFIFSFTF